MCHSGTYGFGVTKCAVCKSAYFVVPHRMDLNIHSDIYLLNMKEKIYYILWYVYIIFITYLHLH